MRIPFDIKYRPQIESGEYKVETRDGKPVRIICWDRKYGYPIVGLAYEKAAGRESYVNACLDGTAPTNGDDLFIITPEEELTEFEKVVKDRLWRTLEYSETFRKDENKWTRELAAELLSVARNQLFEEQYSSDPHKTDLYKLGKSEALKDLPRWKKSNLVDTVNLSFKRIGGKTVICYHNRMIALEDLKKLPGF